MTSPERRRFNTGERAALYLAADGHCARCGAPLETGWHGDHVHPYSKGGRTDVINGQALCPRCNLLKGSKVANLRLWQQRATEAFYAKAADKRDFLVCATPGAGKTTYALHLAVQLLDQQVVERVVVIVPTDALREQWAGSAAAAGLSLKPVAEPEDYDKAGYKGCIATYQQLLGAGSDLMRRVTRKPTLAILDEVHHAGHDRSWGTSLQSAVEHAAHRLSLTGTPWRRDATSPIPFVEYDKNGTVVVDYAYEYGEAVADEVCRRIEFHAYDGEARWLDRTRASREGRDIDSVNVEYSARISGHMREDDVSAALDVLYEPGHRWMPDMLAHADAMLTELREEVHDAAGLVVAERQWHARAYAKLIEKLTGTLPPVVVSDPQADPTGEIAKRTIEAFKDGTGRWIVAVKMISEGVDIPRLAVGVYASKTQTPLFFRQVVGRFVRTRPNEELNARLLIPAVPQLLKHALEIEEELRHQLEIAKDEDERDGEGEGLSGVQGEFDFRESLSASEPIFDRAILRGEECTAEEVAGAEAQCRLLGIPTRYAVNLVPLMRAQQAAAAATVTVPQPAAPPTPRHKREQLLRGEIDMLVGKLSYRVNKPKKEINAELLRAGCAPRKKASVEELEMTKAIVTRWLAAA